MSLFETAMLGIGATFLAKGASTLYESYAPEGMKDLFGAGDLGGFLGDIAGSMASGEDAMKMPEAGSVSVPTRSSVPYGSFSPGKTATVPMGSGNAVPNAIAKANVQKSLIRRVQTVGVPSPNLRSSQPNIKLGSSQPSKVRRTRRV